MTFWIFADMVGVGRETGDVGCGVFVGMQAAEQVTSAPLFAGTVHVGFGVIRPYQVHERLAGFTYMRSAKERISHEVR